MLNRNFNTCLPQQTPDDYNKRCERDVYDDLCTAIAWLKDLDKKLHMLHPSATDMLRTIIVR